MKPAAYHIREALALHEGFRRLGFIPDDIYIVARPDQFGVLLKAQHREFFCHIDDGPFDVRQLQADWTAAVRWWNDPASSEADRMEIWHASAAVRGSVDLLAGLSSKGFSFPCSERPS